MGSARNLIAQIVIPFDVLPKQVPVVPIGDQVESQRKAFVKRGQHRVVWFTARIKRYFPGTPVESGAQLWQRREPSSVLQFLQEEEALVIL